MSHLSSFSLLSASSCPEVGQRLICAANIIAATGTRRQVPADMAAPERDRTESGRHAESPDDDSSVTENGRHSPAANSADRTGESRPRCH
jgi:hypothetical protein